MNPQIGIIGAGEIGLAFTRQFLKAGYSVTLSNSRGAESLTGLAKELGGRARAGTVQEAAAAPIVVLSVPWKHLTQALAGLPPWEGRIVVDTANPIITPGFTIANLDGRTSSEVVADLVPGARLVKAGNTLPPELVEADPRVGNGRRVLFLSGNDTDAKATVSRVLEKVGFATVDLGGLVAGGKLQQFPGGPLPALNLIKLS
ncbi:MAG TPA: NAD(P)-binding domain-containing protein [Chthoniobacterales bacterium]